ncbi:hypothetical protein [Aeromicrobium sp. CF3.5]|uniref:hypothetical protein n=1 Tax=Aeromicrobium sp. CF3.5 TaxID=3373078 RepID=UPI003EE7E6D3
MSPARLALGAVGVAAGLFGLWHLIDDGTTALLSLGLWLIGAIIVHDAILAPLTIGLTILAARFLPTPARMPAVVGFVVWGTCSIAFFAVISGQAGKTGNETIGGQPYTAAWLTFTALIVIAVGASALVRARRASSR